MAEEPKTPEKPTTQSTDPQADSKLDPTGQKHLANALRVSFRVLTVVMVLVLILFLGTGTQIIEPQQKGIKSVFGKVVETVDQGMAITWPFPIGNIEKIDVKEQPLPPVTEFWVQESPDNVGKAMAQWRVESKGLRPAWEGALFTGDHNLIHVKLNCTWTVADPVAVMANLHDAKTIIAVMKNILSSAAIRSAAGKTAEGLRKGRDQFVSEVKADAQRRLNVLTLDRRKVADLKERLGGMLSSLEPQKYAAAQKELSRLMSQLKAGLRDNETRNKLLETAPVPIREQLMVLLAAIRAEFDHDGIRIKLVKVAEMSWPIRTLAAYKDAQDAKAKKAIAITRAKGEAAEILSNAAGRSYPELIDMAKVLGVTEGETPPAKTPPAKTQPKVETDLIGQYISARKEGDAGKATATALLEEIDSVLVGNQIGGKANRLIRDAGGYRTRVRQETEARVNDFKKKIEGFKDFPRLTLDRLWAETRDKILGAPLAEKFYLPPGRQKFVLDLNRDPNVAKWIREEGRKKKKGKGKPGESGKKK